MTAKQIVVEVVGDAKKFSSATEGAVKSAEGLTGKLQGIGKGMVIGAGIGAFNLLSSAVDMGIGKLGEMADAYREDQAGQELLAQAMKNNLPNWDGNRKGAEDFAGSLGRLGFADDEVRVSLGQLVGVTHDLKTAQDLTNLAADLARAKNIDLATATDIVTKAHEGNGKALKALGVDIGGAKTAAEFLDAIQKNTAGSAEAWAQTNTGKLAVSNVKVGEAMEKVGKIVDNVAQVVVPLLSDAFVWLADTAGQVWDAIQPVITQIADVLKPAFETLGKIIPPLWEGIKSAIKSAVAAIMAVVQPMIDAIQFAISLLPKMGMKNQVQPAGTVVAPVKSVQGSGAYGVGGAATSTLPGFAAGGTVPGAPGAAMLAVVHGGETITPAGGAGVGFGPGAIIVNGQSDPAATAREVMLAIKRELTRQGMSFSSGF